MKDVRTRLIDATFAEVYTKGYSGASLANILKKSEVKKGAMYHYFPSKKAMVLNMIEEHLEKRIEKKWQVLTNTDENIIDTLILIIKDTNNWDLKNGCPLGNLLQESLEYDQDFADILTSILNKWKNHFSKTLKIAQEKNQFNKDVDTHECATFLIATIEGALLLAKKYEDNQEVFFSCMNQLSTYLNSLRNK